VSTDPALGEYMPKGTDVYFPEKKFNASKLKGSGGIFNSINLSSYAYAQFNPILLVDPDGRSPVLEEVAKEIVKEVGKQVAKTAPGLEVAVAEPTVIGEIIWGVATTAMIGVGLYNVYKMFSQGDTDTDRDDQKSPSGSYTIYYEGGYKYHGKGNYKRALKSAGEKSWEYGKKVLNIDWTPSSSDREGFKDEYRRMQTDSNPDYEEGYQNPINYNKIQSPGKRYCLEDGDC